MATLEVQSGKHLSQTSFCEKKTLSSFAWPICPLWYHSIEVEGFTPPVVHSTFFHFEGRNSKLYDSPASTYISLLHRPWRRGELKKDLMKSPQWRFTTSRPLHRTTSAVSFCSDFLQHLYFLFFNLWLQGRTYLWKTILPLSWILYLFTECYLYNHVEINLTDYTIYFIKWIAITRISNKNGRFVQVYQFFIHFSLTSHISRGSFSMHPRFSTW